VIQEEAEEILKYKDLTVKIERMWNRNTKVLPVIKGTFRTISKSFRKYPNNIPGKHKRKKPQKTAKFGPCAQTSEGANAKV